MITTRFPIDKELTINVLNELERMYSNPWAHIPTILKTKTRYGLCYAVELVIRKLRPDEYDYVYRGDLMKLLFENAEEVDATWGFWWRPGRVDPRLACIRKTIQYINENYENS